ncbi:ubiquitin-specific protease [Suhomyces tanzawaensis NRRL Y-17324]|uniref:Ubiquitin carboxyl-terminal hydrolase 2 n=1 Tax=Suhomyces tanzawaensis NRRL Y-17324 TaxID=984487 RepID=A0A1E4SR92_9ASCO|nr:ubiquitin-specific protease [Suhomyces tanzawaensis NRRL Y-17324]ODV82030.1 ubiquitin-specific protease [Suhomyces tanzawaensis NRRL Y-17324]
MIENTELMSGPAPPPRSGSGSSLSADLAEPLNRSATDVASIPDPNRQFKSNNPFLQQADWNTTAATVSGGEWAVPTNSEDSGATEAPQQELKAYPFKTLNRILDDLRWTVPFKAKFSTSLLNNKPIDYSSNLSKMAQSNQFEYDVLTLNNSLNYAPSYEEIPEAESNRTLKIIRGLITNAKHDTYHFRLMILEKVTNPFSPIDKHEYHIIPHSVLAKNELDVLRHGQESGLLDDAYFMSSNSNLNHILRVSVFNPEFSRDDLFQLTDEETIKNRYLEGMKNHPNLSADTIPNPIHCFKTMIKVLKGPILLPPTDSIKTISLKNTVLDSQVDIAFLLNRLSFSLNSEETDLIPPSLHTSPELKEAYVRKVIELIFCAKVYGKKYSNNEFETQYSYSDNFSLIFSHIPEFDKHINLVHFKTHNSNHLPFLINLSICSFFQDELIVKCFENTVKSDLTNKLHYVDSLKSTINFRNGSSTNNKLAKYLKNLSTHGELVGWYDYVESMKALGLTAEDAQSLQNIDDDVVIAMYKTNYKSDLKNYTYFHRHLTTIAKARNSTKLTNFIDNEIIPLELALEELGVEEITEDEVIITAYEFGLDEVMQSNGFNSSSPKVSLLSKSLLSVAVNRKSYLLLNYLETKLPDTIKVSKDITYARALEILGCQTSSSEFELVTNFQSRLISNVENELNDVRILRYSLKLIAENKKSDILFSFLKNGRIDPTLLPAENWPAGLDNIGNTCYLNSLLQYYFCIKPLRELILNFEEKDLDLLQNRKIGGRKVEEAEIARSKQFIYHLKHLFNEMIHTDKRCVEPSKELAYLSFLHLSQPVTFKENRFDEKENDIIDLESDEPILVSSQSESDLDVEMIESSAPELDSHIENVEIIADESHEERNPSQILPISTDQMESTIEVGRQQDVTECIENVTYQIETALEPEELEEDGEQVDLIKKLFYGKIKQTITPLDLINKQPRISAERFFSLIINVSDNPKNIYDSLDNYFSEDLVKLEEGYVKKSLTISELPEVLQFHVQRVMFDRERLVPYKSLQPIPFSEKIYLDRYLDTTDEEILSKRNEVFKWKSEIQMLHERKESILKVDDTTHMNIIDSLRTTKKFIESKIIPNESFTFDEATLMKIDNQITSLNEDLTKIEIRLTELREKVSNQFTSYTKVGYSIFAIFIHRGEASYGHYWVYIKDPHRNVFRKYNDEVVTEVPFSEVFNFNDGNTATPYYIVYVKENLENEYVEPLKRVIGTPN